jgi:cytochrome c oxidase subunit I+III
MVTTFIFFLLGGLLALAIRLQLAQPNGKLLGPDMYNQVFTMHGSTMMFLFAVPVMQAVAVYLVPLMIGARSVAFPRMNAFAWWIFTMGGIMLYAAFFLDIGPDAGWFAYVPLAGPQYSPGKRIDFWAQMITFTELSALMEAIVLITTILKMRAPGMTLNRMPLFVWTMLVTSFMVLFAMPAVMLASTALITDRLVGTHFYNPGEGGDALLWQHLFWFFGHPEVYLIFIPPLGFMSSIIATFSRRPVVGYPAMVLALIATAFLAFGLWVHHMFATNLPELGKTFFTAASLMIAIPTAVQIFCWIATLWTGRINFKTPLLFVLAFFVILLLGGLTGLMLASVSLDYQLHDTFSSSPTCITCCWAAPCFPLFGAFYYWFPKFTGRMLSERLGRWNSGCSSSASTSPSSPCTCWGCRACRAASTPIPRRWAGAAEHAVDHRRAGHRLSVLLFIVNVLHSRRRGELRQQRPLGRRHAGMERRSPPPMANFKLVPVVHGRYPLWQEARRPGHVTGLANDYREVLITSVADAQLDHRLWLPGPTPGPSWRRSRPPSCSSARSSRPGRWCGRRCRWRSRHHAVVLAQARHERPAHRVGDGAMSAPDPKRDGRLLEDGRVLDVSTLPTFAFGQRSPMWWGTMGLMLIEGTVFALTIMAYFYLRSHATAWPMSRFPPELLWGNVNTAIMLASMVPNHFAKRAAERLDLQKVRFWMVVCLLVSAGLPGRARARIRGAQHALGQQRLWLRGLDADGPAHHAPDHRRLRFRGADGADVTGPLEGKRYVDVSENAAYWYFVVLSWLPIYAVVYWGARY